LPFYFPLEIKGHTGNLANYNVVEGLKRAEYLLGSMQIILPATSTFQDAGTG
jgi:hypothetical protein